MTTKYLTIDDVCEMLSISRRSLERMRSEKDKPNEGNKLTRIGEIMESMNSHEPKNLLAIDFPAPDLHIGRSPRWEKNKLITWLEKNGNKL